MPGGFQTRHHQLLAVEGESAEDLATGGGSSDTRSGHGRHAERAADLESGLQLAGEVLVEEPHDDRQVGPHALGVERDLDVHDVLRRRHDERPRLHDPQPLEDIRIARVGDLDLHSGGARRLDPVVVAGERHDPDFLAQPMQQLDDAVADDPQSADDVVLLHSARSPATAGEDPEV